MKLKLLTLNIRCDTGEDGDFNWVHRRDRVFQLLRESGADVIALQEVLPNQRQDLSKAFPPIAGWDEDVTSGEAASNARSGSLHT